MSGICLTLSTPTKRSKVSKCAKIRNRYNQVPHLTQDTNAKHLVEYLKQLLHEENKKSGNAMQQPMHSYVCGINLKSESSLVLSDLLFT